MAEFIVIIRRNLVLHTYTVSHLNTLIEAIHDSIRSMQIREIEQIEEIRAISVADMIDVDVKQAIKNSFPLGSYHESD